MKDNIINFEEFLTRTEIESEDKELSEGLNEEKPKIITLKKKYEMPQSKCVGLETQPSPVMGCWNCGEDGIHC